MRLRRYVAVVGPNASAMSTSLRTNSEYARAVGLLRTAARSVRRGVHCVPCYTGDNTDVHPFHSDWDKGGHRERCLRYAVS